MALVLKDRVRETSTTVGNGTFTLAGAVAGFQSFAAIGNSNTTFYTIVDGNTGAWEVGVGTYTASGTTLSRDTVLANSLGDTTKISFGAGTKDVFVTYPAEKSVATDLANTFTADQTISGNLTLNAQGDVRFADSDSSNWVAFQAPTTVASNVTWTLPSADGTTGQVLSTNGSGTLSWATASGGISAGKSIAFAMIFGF
jgi:hypothetical protein